MLSLTEKGGRLSFGLGDFPVQPYKYATRVKESQDGGFDIDWIDMSRPALWESESGLKRTSFSSSGVVIAEALIKPAEALEELDRFAQPTTDTLADGSSVSVRNANIEGKFALVAERHDDAGNLIGDPIFVTSGVKQEPTVTALAHGGFVVGWFGGGNGTVNVQAFSATGDAIGAPIIVDTRAYSASIAGLADGSLVVAWRDFSGVGPLGGGTAEYSSIKAQVYSIVSNDTYHVEPGNFVDGGEGFDTAVFDRSSTQSTQFSAAQLLAEGTIFSNIEAVKVVGSDFGANIDLRNLPLAVQASEAVGGQHNDNLYANERGSKLYGDDGQDVLYASAARDTLDGGAGYDVVDYEFLSRGVSVDLQRQNYLGSAARQADGDLMIGIEEIRGSAFNDKLLGDEGNERFYGQNGNDRIESRGGSDVIYGGAGNDTLDGGDGYDYLDGGTGDDTVSYASAKSPVQLSLMLQPEFGHLIWQQTDNSGLDTLLNFENATGSRFDDQIIGSGGNNILDGDAGDDWLDGRGGNDRLFGGSGNDTFVSRAGNDVLRGDDGYDTVDYSFSTGGVTVYLGLNIAQKTGGAGTDTLNGIEDLLGSAFDDSLNGSALKNFIRGNDGNDFIAGHAGDDRLVGGDGDDRITGGAGADLLFGGPGADLFRYTAVDESRLTSTDRILDFSRLEGDRIGLAGIDADTRTAKDDAFTIVDTFQDGIAGGLRIQNDLGGDITAIFGEVNGDRYVDFILYVSPLIPLIASDFVL